MSAQEGNELREHDLELARCAADIVRKVTGGRVDHVRKVQGGSMTHKYEVLPESLEPCIVRFYPSDRSFVVNYEPDVVRRCSAAGLPVPQVLADSRTGPEAKLQYMLYRMIRGETLAERLASLGAMDLSNFCRELAGCLYQLQDIGFSEFGDLRDARNGSSVSWDSFVRESFSEGLSAITQHHLLDDATVGDLRAIAPCFDMVVAPQQSEFVWGDINSQNILVDDAGRLAGLIDFEGVLAGDSLATMGYCYAAHGNQTWFASLMRMCVEPLDRHQMRRIFIYAILRTMRVARFAHRPLPTGLARAPLSEVFPGFRLSISELLNRATPTAKQVS
jgi:aminoglycoside phosphotransferase (APT) family kinase protein